MCIICLPPTETLTISRTTYQCIPLLSGVRQATGELQSKTLGMQPLGKTDGASQRLFVLACLFRDVVATTN
jgi:hypothetical protein